MTKPESERIGIVEAVQSAMAGDIRELKDEMKDLTKNVNEVKLTIAKWAGAIIVAVTIGQFALSKFL